MGAVSRGQGSKGRTWATVTAPSSQASGTERGARARCPVRGTTRPTGQRAARQALSGRRAFASKRQGGRHPDREPHAKGGRPRQRLRVLELTGPCGSAMCSSRWRPATETAGKCHATHCVANRTWGQGQATMESLSRRRLDTPERVTQAHGRCAPTWHSTARPIVSRRSGQGFPAMGLGSPSVSGRAGPACESDTSGGQLVMARDQRGAQQGREEREDGALLAAVLGCRGGEHGPHLSNECTLRPERSRLVDEGAHLCADVAEARGSAKDDRVVMASSSAFASAAAWSASPPAPRNTSGGTVSGTRFASTPASGTLRAPRATACFHGLDVAVGGCGFQVFGNSLGKAAKALAATRGHDDRIGNGATKKCG